MQNAERILVMFINQDIEDIKNIILETAVPEKIYLFGSYAYGMPNKHSDYDFYVVIPDNGARPVDVMERIGLAVYPIQKKPIDILAGTVTAFERRKKRPTLERSIAKNGVILYERNKRIV